MAQVPKQGPIAHGVLAGLTQFLSLAAQPDGLRTWAEHASVWEAPQEALGLLDRPASMPASRMDREARTLDTEALIPELAQEGTPVPAPEPAATSRMDAETPVSIEDDEPVSPVVVEAEAEVEVEAEPAASTADAGWFF